MAQQRLFQVQLLWNARGEFKTHALVWGDMVRANAIAQAVWEDYTPCRSCGMGVRVACLRGWRWRRRRPFVLTRACNATRASTGRDLHLAF